MNQIKENISTERTKLEEMEHVIEDFDSEKITMEEKNKFIEDIQIRKSNLDKYEEEEHRKIREKYFNLNIFRGPIYEPGIPRSYRE